MVSSVSWVPGDTLFRMHTPFYGRFLARARSRSEWSEVELPLADLKPVRWVMLPQGYPGEWNYWVEPGGRRNRIDLADVERVQLSLRKSDLGATPAAAGVDVERVAIRF